MEKQADGSLESFVQRRVSQIKVTTRLLEHELDTAKGNDVTLDRDLVASLLDVLEIYVDDVTGVRSGKVHRKVAEDKPAVTRLN